MSIRGWAGSQESTALLSNKACLCEEWGGSHMMIQSAGFVLTTLNGFIIVWSGNRRCVVLFVIHYMSIPHCYRQASLSRQRISCLNSAGAWDRIWHTHIFCAFPTVSVSPSPSPGTPPLPSLTARIVPWRQACIFPHQLLSSW